MSNVPDVAPGKRPLWIQRRDFTKDLADLVWYANTALSVEVVFAEIIRPKEMAVIYAEKGLGIINSLHCLGLAGDLLVYVNGFYQKDHQTYETLGAKWKELNPLNRWGGDFKRDDADHFERRPE